MISWNSTDGNNLMDRLCMVVSMSENCYMYTAVYNTILGYEARCTTMRHHASHCFVIPRCFSMYHLSIKFSSHIACLLLKPCVTYFFVSYSGTRSFRFQPEFMYLIFCNCKQIIYFQPVVRWFCSISQTLSSFNIPCFCMEVQTSISCLDI